MKKLITVVAFCLITLPFVSNAQSGADSSAYDAIQYPKNKDNTSVNAGTGSGNANAIPTKPPTYSSANGGGSGGVSGSNIQCKITDFKSIVTCFGSIINTVIPIIIALTVLFIVWNIFKLIRSGDGENLKGIKDIILWGVLGLFCMLSIWGFVAILSNTFQLDKNPIVPEPFKISN